MPITRRLFYSSLVIQLSVAMVIFIRPVRGQEKTNSSSPPQVTQSFHQQAQAPELLLPEHQSALKAVERVEKLERESSVKPGSPFDAGREVTDALKSAASKLDTYLQDHPTDIPSLLLAARLGRALEVTTPATVNLGAGLKQQVADMDARQRQRLEQLHSFCDRVLAVDANNAEAHYWKAQLYGLSHYVMSDHKTKTNFVDLASALRMAQRASDLAPQNTLYREQLALYLFFNHQEKEAMAQMREVAGGQHLMYLLLKDREAVPIPPKAVPLEDVSISITFGGVGDEKRQDNYPFLRSQVYLLPMRASDAQAFWRRTWPDFQLCKPGGQNGKGSKDRGSEPAVFMQIMKWRGTELYPSPTAENLDAKPKEGIALIVMELRKVQSPIPLPEPLDKIFCILTFHNLRPTAMGQQNDAKPALAPPDAAHEFLDLL